jgi:hypothetical protein
LNTNGWACKPEIFAPSLVLRSVDASYLVYAHPRSLLLVPSPSWRHASRVRQHGHRTGTPPKSSLVTGAVGFQTATSDVGRAAVGIPHPDLQDARRRARGQSPASSVPLSRPVHITSQNCDAGVRDRALRTLRAVRCALVASVECGHSLASVVFRGSGRSPAAPSRRTTCSSPSRGRRVELVSELLVELADHGCVGNRLLSLYCRDCGDARLHLRPFLAVLPSKQGSGSADCVRRVGREARRHSKR